MHTEATTKIAQERNLSVRLLDEVKPHGYCPGFGLFEVTVEGERLLMAADAGDYIGTRLFFGGIDDRKVEVQIERIGINPDVKAWEDANPHY